MNSVKIPEDCAKQWEILLLLLSSEEKKIDRTNETEIDTMKYFYNNEGVRKILLQWLNQMQQTYARKTSESDTALKCDDVSLLWRQRGNDRFRANAVEESYNCYSKSVIYAHQNRQMFPLALANRSAALLRLKKYKVCLSDISLALNAGYPVELRHKLLLRRADCYIELGQKMKARTALDDALEHAKTLQLTPSQIAEFERHIKTLEKKLDTAQLAVDSDDVSLPDCHKGENPDFVCASSVLELRRNEAVGRHVVAREPVSRGDTLFSEAPYAWVALPGPQPVCDYCCGVDVNPVPCPGCSRAVYCSAECRAAARHHRWECGAARADLLPTIGIAHLALRVLLLTAENGFPEVPTASKPSTAAELFHAYSQVDNVAIYNRDTPPFYRMFNLVTNFDKMNNTDYIQYSLTATLLTLYLEHFTSFFSFLPSRAPYELPGEQWRLFSGALVLRSMAQLVCNGHAALSLAVVDDCDQNRTISEREVRRATAIYPSAAMMNHSCDPNIINTFHKLRLVVVAGRELAAGGEVCNCYGPRRSREPAAARRAALRAQYLFHCLCDACTDKQQNNAQLFSAYLCQACKGPVAAGRGRCQQCRSPVDLQRALDALDRADDLIAQAERCSSVEARCEKTQQSLRLKQQVLHRHHGAVRAAADRLARIYADLGEFSKSVELIKQNIQSLEYQFGSFSVEVAHELRKLSEVMLERILHTPQHADYRDWCLETHKILKKAVQLTELNYGSWEPLARRLRRQEALVAALLADSRGPDSDSVHHTLHYNLKI